MPALFITPGYGVTLGCMKTVQLSELGRLADDVRKGETIEVRDGEKVVAQLVPFREQTIEERIDELARQGLITPGSEEPLPDDFLMRELPRADKSVLDQLLEDRRAGR
jgi:antitoxin (DNA-binding transcriptional repressor) of toxin-antitoxin stability system